MKKQPYNRSRQITQFEQSAYKDGYSVVAGVDEVGRGPLAGPVYAAACVIKKGVFFERIDDSKRLSPSLRKELCKELLAHREVQSGIGIATVCEIDRLNILQATRIAMCRAVKALPVPPDFLLVDALQLSVSIDQLPIVQGDLQSQSIMAASVIAKEARDEHMCALHDQYPEYGFNQHKGYGTKRHREAMKKYGRIEGVHRKSFRLKHENC